MGSPEVWLMFGRIWGYFKLQASKLRDPNAIVFSVSRIYAWQFCSAVLGMCGGVLIARVLGPEKKGIVDLYRVLESLILDVGLLGFGSGLFFQLVNKRVPLRYIHGTALAFAASIGLVILCIGVLLRNSIAPFFSGLPLELFLLAFALAPMSFYLLLWSTIMAGINRAEESYRVAAWFDGFGMFGIVVLVLTNLVSPSTVVFLASCVLLFNAWHSFRILFSYEPHLEPSRSIVAVSLRYGLVVYIGFVANMLHFKIDQLMINSWLGTEDLGIYALSVRLAETLFFVDGAIAAATVYHVGSSGSTAAYSLTMKVVKSQLVLGSLGGIGLAVVAYPLVVWLYGMEFERSVSALILLIPGVMAWGIARSMSQYIAYNQGRQWYPTIFAVLGMLMNIGLNYLTIPSLGINGAALASTLSYGCVMIATSVVFYRLRSVEWNG